MRSKGQTTLDRKPTAEFDVTSDEESPNLLAIAIPGIRTDGHWVDKSSARKQTWSHPIKIVKASPDDRISTATLLFRWKARSKKEEITIQIMNIIINYQNTHSISIICHSMGASFLSEIVDKIDFCFDKIILLGSVCHYREALRLKQKCKYLVNHCGIKDAWPVRAELARPWNYSATGTLGFRGPYVENIFFENDHVSCTNPTHIDDFVIPQILGNAIQIPEPVTTIYSSTQIKYSRLSIVGSFLIIILSLIFTPLWVTVIISIFGILISYYFFLK